MTTTIFEAIKSLKKDAQVTIGENSFDQIEWLNGTKEIPKADIQAEMDRMDKEFADNKYQRDRQAEYPTIQELVVALYDTDDKAAIEAKRAEIKKKYPKP